MLNNLILFFFGFFAIIASLCVLSARNPVHSVFFLILVFCLCSLILLTLTVDFLSIIFVVVYVGAIAVLFLFVVMMLNIRLAHIEESIIRFIPMGFFIGIIFFSEFYYILYSNNYNDTANISIEWINFIDNYTNIFSIGLLVYTHFLHLFLISGLVLLLAMIGTISLTLHHSINVRRQLVYNQLSRKIATSIYFYNPVK